MVRVRTLELSSQELNSPIFFIRTVLPIAGETCANKIVTTNACSLHFPHKQIFNLPSTPTLLHHDSPSASSLHPRDTMPDLKPPDTRSKSGGNDIAMPTVTEAEAEAVVADAGGTTTGVHTPRPTTSRVFTVVEILEQVLSNLSVTALTRVEAVNSLWKKLIRKP